MFFECVFRLLVSFKLSLYNIYTPASEGVLETFVRV
jgi:hypothetical protein